MGEYIECEECGFVLVSESSTAPTPKHHDSCPGCEATEFCFTGT